MISVTDLHYRVLFQFILKQYIGGFRPYFLAVCNPNADRLRERLHAAQSIISSKPPPTDVPAYHRVFATVRDCQTATEIKSLIPALQSFPSGHSGSAFAAGVFLSLYLNAKLKAFADYHTSFLKLLMVLSPLIGATFIAGNLMIDHVSFIPSISLVLTFFALTPTPTPKRYVAYTRHRTITLPTFSPAPS